MRLKNLYPISEKPKEWDTKLLFTNHEGDMLTVSGWRQKVHRHLSYSLASLFIQPRRKVRKAALSAVRLW